MNAMAPIPSLIPENAPFSTEQRAWLNGFFAAYLGVNGAPAPRRAPRPRHPTIPTRISPGTMRRSRWPNAWSLPRAASRSAS